MSKWNDRKKKDDEQNAQIKKPEESAVKDYSAGAIGKAYANTERPAMKTAQTPSFDEPSLTGVYGLQTNSKGESVMDMTGKTSGSLQGMKLALNNELTISGQTKLNQSLNKQIDSEQETRQKNANARNTAMLELAEMPLMGFDGQSINANTADAATVIRGINAIADDTLRARAAKAFKTLTQTEGSRFYGENTDSVGTFLESANLTRDEYRDAAEDYASRFYGDGKHGKEDAAAYLKARQEIEESAYSDYAKSQLTAALDKAYTGITGGETPSDSAEGASAEAEDEKRAPEEEQKKEKKPGFWSGLTGKVPEQEEQEKAENPPQAKAQSRIVSQTMTASTAPGFPTAGKANGKAPEVQGPVQMTPEERIVAQGGMSFAEWMATTPSVSSADTSLEEGGRERTDEAGAEIRMHEAQTVGEAADALLKGRYDQIEGAGKDELDRMLAESGNARRMIGTLTEADSQRIILGNDMADAVTYGNIAAQGQTVKTLYDVMKSDSFPDELRGDVMAQMVVWAAQAEAMEKAGTLGGDAELTESCIAGSVDFIVGMTGSLVNYIPEAALFDLPNVFPDLETAREVLDGPILAELQAAYEAGGLKLFGYADSGFRVMTSSKAVRQMSDFSGIKIRTMENSYHMDFWKKLKAMDRSYFWQGSILGVLTSASCICPWSKVLWTLRRTPMT